MTHRLRWLAVAAIALIPSDLLGQLQDRAGQDSEMRAAALVLFDRFETVAYTKTALLSTAEIHEMNKVAHAADTLDLPFLELLDGLSVLGPDMERDLEKNYGAVLIGAKEFGQEPIGPEAQGMVSSRKCYIGILGVRTKPDVDLDFRKASHESIEGRKVWTWSIPSGGGSTRPTKYYAAQIAGVYFVMANSRQDFQEAANALATAASAKPSPISVSGWGTFSTHDYWAYRLFRRNGVTSLESAGMGDLTPDVVALTFYADPDKKTGMMQVFSSDTSMKTIPKILAESELNRLQPLRMGVWQQSVPFDNALFSVLYVFGFGVAV